MRRSRAKQQSGISVIEAMISMVVLTVGLVSVLGLFSIAIASTHSAKEDLLAKLLSVEALESIFTARNTSQITWDQIQNTATIPGIFQTGLQNILDPGPDGLVATADDVQGNVTDPLCPGPSPCLTQPGPDGLMGTADDVRVPLNNFQRRIAITQLLNPDGSVSQSLRQITVTVQYTAASSGNIPRSYLVTAYISRYR